MAAVASQSGDCSCVFTNAAMSSASVALSVIHCLFLPSVLHSETGARFGLLLTCTLFSCRLCCSGYILFHVFLECLHVSGSWASSSNDFKFHVSSQNSSPVVARHSLSPCVHACLFINFTFLPSVPFFLASACRGG